MQCPVDGTTLAISDKQGIEIDYCPQCRGVWLDRGELEKLIERSDHGFNRGPAPQHEYHEQRGHERRHDYDDDDYYKHGHDGHHGKHKKREGLFDIFDF